MRKTRWIAPLLAIGLGTCTGPVSTAKPPDLPATNDVRCQETDSSPLRVYGDDTPPASTAEPPVCIDVWCAQALPVIAQRFCQRIFAIMQTSPADADAPDAPARDPAAGDLARGAVDPQFAVSAEKAQRLYELATRCARQGKLAEARAHLREAHLANPTCRFGRLAIERLQELEALPPGEEPQSDDGDAMQTERAFQRMRATTQPLGLVQPRTY